VLELLEDIQELRPTLFSSVPRLWNRIYDKVMAQVRHAPGAVEGGAGAVAVLWWCCAVLWRCCGGAGDEIG
jgi:long-subunit acyl-CoA synthetase (AMP-forming)